MKVLLAVAAMICLAVSATLGYVAVIALRRGEGVFLGRLALRS